MKEKSFRPVAIVGGLRIPFVKSFTQYSKTTNQEMLTHVIESLVQKYGLSGKRVGDVALGYVMHHAADWNLAREVVLGTSLSADTPAYNVQRACGTSLETTWQIALKVAASQMETGIAGGCDTNSDLPVEIARKTAWHLLELRKQRTFLDKLKYLPKVNLTRDIRLEFPAVVEPRTHLSMGQHCEKMVQEWKIDQKSQDELAFQSHQLAAKAYQEGFYDDLIVEFKGLKKDTLVRGETTLEKLAKLKPAFDFTGKGTLTAGNSTPLTDGASGVLLASEAEAKKNNWNIQAYFVDAEVRALDFVHGEGLLMAPTAAVGHLLKRNGLTFQDFDFFEIHEAFAGQVLCTLKAWEDESYCKKLGLDSALGKLDSSKMNLKGGSVALGHPFAATGARIVASLSKMLQQKGKGRGLISICTAGGMGVAAILER